ncbi:MAG TPA: hypothetical protein VN672_09135 [Solirubrobacteraceae bacterium]|nr:hypothetical protein [Solirubrobacteraceae bacterium]
MSSHSSIAADGTASEVTRSANRGYEYEIDEPRGEGWVIFAGVLIMLVGVMNTIYGIAAISKSSFYAANTRFVVSDLKTWGWIVLAIGALQICVAAGVWAQAQWARWTGVGIAGLNFIAQLMFIAAYPWLSITLATLDILVIYALVAYGGRLERD